jgi:L-ascorbate metabolism protein UlaG (beta-lactamase superfamily)
MPGVSTFGATGVPPQPASVRTRTPALANRPLERTTMIWTPFSQWALEGNQRFLGYALTFREEGRDVSIIHSGDTIPFAGQGEEYRRMRPDLLLLPVKGRSEALAARGIAGNLTLDEAVTLTVESEAPAMIAHHHGLFAFNTLPVAGIERKAAEPGLPIRLIPARLGLEVLVSSS